MPLGINKKETVTLLLSYFIFLSSFCQSQYLVKGEVIGASDGTLLYSSVDTSKCFTYGRSTTVYDKNLYIVGDAGCVTIGSRWYIVMNDNDIFIAEKYFFHDNKKIDSLLSIIKQKTPNIEDRKRLAPAELNQIKVEENKQIEEEKQRAVLAERLQHQKDLKQADSVSKMLDEKLATLRIKNVMVLF